MKHYFNLSSLMPARWRRSWRLTGQSGMAGVREPGKPQRQLSLQNLIVIKAFLEAAKRYVRGGYDVVVDGIANWFIKNELEK